MRSNLPFSAGDGNFQTSFSMRRRVDDGSRAKETLEMQKYKLTHVCLSSPIWPDQLFTPTFVIDRFPVGAFFDQILKTYCKLFTSEILITDDGQSLAQLLHRMFLSENYFLILNGHKNRSILHRKRLHHSKNYSLSIPNRNDQSIF